AVALLTHRNYGLGFLVEGHAVGTSTAASVAVHYRLADAFPAGISPDIAEFLPAIAGKQIRHVVPEKFVNRIAVGVGHIFSAVIGVQHAGLARQLLEPGTDGNHAVHSVATCCCNYAVFGKCRYKTGRVSL